MHRFRRRLMDPFWIVGLLILVVDFVLYIVHAIRGDWWLVGFFVAIVVMSFSRIKRTTSSDNLS
jgi:hypothetical protein